MNSSREKIILQGAQRWILYSRPGKPILRNFGATLKNHGVYYIRRFILYTRYIFSTE